MPSRRGPPDRTRRTRPSTGPAPAEPAPASASPLTVEGFLARCAAGASTVTFYREELGRLERRVGKPLALATVPDLEHLKKELRATRSGAMRCRTLRTFYRAAKRPDAVEVLALKRQTRRLAPTEILTLPEVNAILAAARSQRDRAFLAVLWETGARVHEVLALDVGDVQELVTKTNGGRAFVTVFFRKVKTAGEEHSSLLIEAGDHVRAWLKAYGPTSTDAPLFPSGRGNGARLTKDGAERLVAATAGRAGIGKHVYPHLFRHSRATHLLRIGVPEAQVKKLLGWKPNSPMLGVYSHLVNRDAYAALLRAHGLEPPEAPENGSLLAAEGELRPVVPIVRAPPGPRPATASAAQQMDERLSRLESILYRLTETDMAVNSDEARDALAGMDPAARERLEAERRDFWRSMDVARRLARKRALDGGDQALADALGGAPPA